MKDRSHPGQEELSGSWHRERAPAPTRFHLPTHTCVHQHAYACAHADTPTRTLTQVPIPRHRALSPVRKSHSFPGPVPLFIHPPSLQSIHSFIPWFLSLCLDSTKATERCGLMGRARGSGGAARRRRARGGAGRRRAPAAGGRRSQPSSSPGAGGSRQTRSPHSGAAARLRRSLSDAPAGRQGPSGSGARGLRSPGSCAQRWVAQAGGAATPDTTSPKSSPDVGVQAWWEEGGLGGAADLGSPQKDRGL